ncbi:MAG: LamG-like jellyroll fold domain-containing protein, partial [Planctomycetota bacterium]
GYLLDTHPGNSLRLITERGALGYDAKLKPDVWVHVAATVDAEGGLALYVDGKQVVSKKEELAPKLVEIDARIARIRKFHQGLLSAGLADSYEAAHARLAVGYLAATCERLNMLSEGRLKRLSGQSQYAADKSYFSTTAKLCEGLERTVASYKDTEDAHEKQVYLIWIAAELPPK